MKRCSEEFAVHLQDFLQLARFDLGRKLVFEIKPRQEKSWRQ